ncbi:MAG: mechanosensitive ion channel family protein [Desulfobacterales bacterium]|nr:mechanosensitive ion channel family protein [Desulfobacterales bacterium]
MFLEKEIFHNTVKGWLLAAAITVIIYFFTRITKHVLQKKLSSFSAKTDTVWDDLAAELVGRINIVFFLFLSVYVGSLKITLPETTYDIFKHAFVIVSLIQVAILISYTINFWIERYRKQKIESNAGAMTTLTSVGFVLRMIIWMIFILIALDNIGVNITTLIAGLGISGIAVALAVQNILGDLFASFSIVLDKPFVIGDFIIVDDYLGTVEHVGLKTTKIRSLSGEQLVFSNADLLKSRIRNYKRMNERRDVFTIGVLYQTPHEILSQIPKMICKIIENQAQVRFDRAHFKEYGDYSLKFEVVYWIQNPDYNVYMDTQQSINLDIFKHFKEAGVEFAYPTQTLLLQSPISVSSG